MNRTELIAALQRIKIETGSFVCLGCGYEHSCGVHGCAIIRAAVERLTEKPPEAKPPGAVDADADHPAASPR